MTTVDTTTSTPRGSPRSPDAGADASCRRAVRLATMTEQDPSPVDESVPADAISWLLLGCMAVAVVAGLFLLLRIP